MANETFPIDLGKLQPLKLDPAVSTLTDAQRAALKSNIQLCRDAIVFFTSLAAAKGLSLVRDRYGPQAIGFLSSARTTNEECYLTQKLARAVIGTNSVHSCEAT